MEFKFDHYLVRYIQNANDSILRFEDSDTCRVFEATLLDRNYMEYTAMGGLEFINRLVLQGLRRSGGVVIALEPFSDRIKLRLSYAHALIPKAIVCDLELMAVRRTSASEDVEVLARRLRELESLIAAWGPKNESTSALIKRDIESAVALIKRDMESATKRLTVLEEMSGGMVLLPGGGPPCPAHVTTVAFIPANSKSFHYSTPTVFLETQSFTPNHLGTPITIKMPTQYCTATDYVIPYAGALPLKSVMPVKHLKHCTTLALVGFTDSADFSFLGEMSQLTQLYITSTIRPVAAGQPEQAAGNHPRLSNISWITKLTHLQTVNFFGCSSLVDITPLKELKKLQQLDLRFTGVKNTECITSPGITITK